MKFNKNSLAKHARACGLSDKGAAYVVRNYMSGAPSRRGNGYFGAVHDTYASRKNGFTVNSESRHCEAPFVMWCEFNSDVLAYLCQPEAIKISYVKDGRKISHFATYDFLVITKDEIYVVECKPITQLEKLCVSHPEKYRKTSSGFECPPAIEVYEKLGIGHKVVTDGDFSVPFTRNCMYLLGFIDDHNIATETDITEIRDSISRQGNRIRLHDLVEIYGQKLTFSALLQNKIFFDGDTQLLFEPHLVWIYHDPAYLHGLRQLSKTNQLVVITEASQLTFQLEFWWGLDRWEIVRFRENPIFNLTIKKPNQIVTLSRSELDQLIQEQSICVKANLQNSEIQVLDFLCSKKADQIEKAIERQKHLSGNKISGPVNEKTLLRWKKKVEEAKKNSQDPLLALVDENDKKGNRKSRLVDATNNLLNKYFDHALKPSPGPLKRYFDLYVEESEELALTPCSHKTFYKRFKLYMPYEKRTRLQKGARAAYALGPTPIDLDLNHSLPYHGDHAFLIAHIDHSPIEMSFVSKLNGEPLKGTLQLSVMYDGYSRNILALYATFEKPSYRSTMMLLRECYRRHKTLPIMLAFDRGSDFESVYLDRTLANIGIHKRRRPIGYSRHGANIERIFGITETEFTHCLAGNKQLQKLGRGQSTTHSSVKAAVWTPDDYYSKLKEYAYNIYPNTSRAGIADTPAHRFEQSIQTFDELPGTRVKSDFDFYLATLPQGKGDGYYTLRHNQIKFNHILYRLSKRVEGYDGRKCRVLLKYNPYDIRYIWARVCNRWVKLNTVDVLVRECYDKNVRHAHLEVYPRSATQLNAYRKGKSSPAIALQNNQEKEKLLFTHEQHSTTQVDLAHNETLENQHFNLKDIDSAIVENMVTANDE